MKNRSISIILILATLLSCTCLFNVSAEHPFTDVAEGKWYENAVDYCYNNGIIKGTTDTTFSPGMNLSRAMFVTMLARTVDETYLEYTDVSFDDVKEGSWYAAAVEWAYQNKITNGTSDTTFSPDKIITREEVCVLFYNYFNTKGIKYSVDEGMIYTYSDAAKVSRWAENGVSFAVSNGLVKSTSSNSLLISPKMTVTRDQAAQFFMTFDELLPKKYFTMSFDDGITQDLRIIDILKKYDVDCCTFMLNTEGLYGASWEWVGQLLGNPEITHQRFTKEELETGIYDGFDVQCHTRTHPSLKAYDNDPDMIIYEVQGNADDLYDITGIKPTGMAWPGGDAECTEKTIELILENTDIRYARGIGNTFSYDLPDRFMVWQPTCSVTDQYLLNYTQNFISADATEDMLFYVWGHGYELDYADYYDEFERMIKMISQDDDIILVTNTEFYELYKDQIPE